MLRRDRYVLAAVCLQVQAERTVRSEHSAARPAGRPCRRLRQRDSRVRCHQTAAATLNAIRAGISATHRDHALPDAADNQGVRQMLKGLRRLCRQTPRESRIAHSGDA